MADKKCTTGANWEDLRVFLALGRYGNLSAAARALSVNHATIARRLQSLEKALGVKLAERRSHGYVLTSEGMRAINVAKDMENSSLLLKKTYTENSVVGSVKINAPPGIGGYFLISKIALLSKEFPLLDLELSTDIKSVSLERHEADISIRVGYPKGGDIIARFLGKLNYGLYLSKESILSEKLENMSFIGFDDTNSHMPEMAWLSKNFPQGRVSFKASNHILQAHAAAAGAGIALLPSYIGNNFPGLKLIDCEVDMEKREIYIIKRRRDKEEPKILLLENRILEIFSIKEFK